MKIRIESSFEKRKQADALILPYREEKNGPVALHTQMENDPVLSSLVEGGFEGEISEIESTYGVKGKEKRVVCLGLGREEAFSCSVLRKAFASVTDFCKKKKIESVNIVLPENSEEEELIAVVDALCMANYSFDEAKKETLKDHPTVLLKEITLIGGKSSWQKKIDEYRLLMESVNLSRLLVNRNADQTKAEDLAEEAKKIAARFPAVSCRVLSKKEIEKEGMGLLLAVNRGALVDPALIVLEYTGDPKSKKKTAFVGKGITFDTGGLNLKPTGGIETMRIDMAGAATVLGILQACASLGIKKNVLGVIAAAENAIGPDSYKPGDIYVSHAGKTVEITNTDAEGRLVLADALSYVQKEYAPEEIIDFATLTGGIVVAIGEEASGLFCNDDGMVDRLEKASEKTGERVWRMPLYPEYGKMLKSSIADMKNSASGRKASPCTGAAFLERFIHKNTRWAHLDIAGTAYLSESLPYYPSFATGVGVKLALAFLEDEI